MQKISANIILFIFLFCGLLLLYRAVQSSGSLTKIDAKVIAKQVEIVSSNNKSNRYGLTFKIDSFQNKLGVYLGTYDQMQIIVVKKGMKKAPSLEPF